MKTQRTRSIDRRTLLGAGATLAVAGGGLGSCVAARGRTGPASALLDDLGLEDESGGFEPIGKQERAKRRERLARILRDAGTDALLVEPGATLEYLAGVRWGLSERLFALVVFADGSALWVSPGFEVPRARERIAAATGEEPRAVLAWQEHEYAFDPLAAALVERGVERIAVDPRARAFVYHDLAEAFVRERVTSGASIVQDLRGVKDAHEIALLRGAAELTKRAINSVAGILSAGMTDHEIGTLMTGAQARLGLKNPWILPLIGPDAAYPHGSPTGRELAPGDAILVDTGGALHGYQSDVTRTWVFGQPPSAELERAWSTVRAAQEAAFATIRPGARCKDVDLAARAVIEEAGYGSGYTAFAHRLGHGIGLEGHEPPHFDAGNELVLEPGMTFSDEPGIYLPGILGVRIEDVVAVTEAGAEVLGTWQGSPSSPGG